MLYLARRIREPCVRIGYESFLLLAMMKRIRVFCWEGENKVDLVEVFAPWASQLLESTAIADAIVCKFVVHAVTGTATCMPVSEEVPLRQCNHFIAAIDTSTVVDEDSAYLVGDIESMYVPHERAVVYTVADGDCAVDTMCVMQLGA